MCYPTDPNTAGGSPIANANQTQLDPKTGKPVNPNGFDLMSFIATNASRVMTPAAAPVADGVPGSQLAHAPDSTVLRAGTRSGGGGAPAGSLLTGVPNALLNLGSNVLLGN